MRETWLFLFIARFLLAANVMGEDAHCRSLYTPWERYLDAEYTVYCSSNPITYDTAEDECRYIEGRLTSIHSYEESNFVHDLVVRAVKRKDFAWIGMVSNGVNWDWSDFTPFFSNFDAYEPDISKGEYCAVVSSCDASVATHL
ncbi:hypothetical protein Y032_0265g674 [Ancylostoma ceylanicum]|uniref:C-type lectin domain-containing protein n=2 Tax=Ancylostoma ceylanicum TaxID=53326 RepID=A0A016SAM9_9BILA|nr:hypothetical protein Y032_0265g674 [Ancylostoma ceylanicum]